MKITESDQTGGQNGWEKIGYAKTLLLNMNILTKRGKNQIH